MWEIRVLVDSHEAMDEVVNSALPISGVRALTVERLREYPPVLYPSLQEVSNGPKQ